MNARALPCAVCNGRRRKLDQVAAESQAEGAVDTQNGISRKHLVLGSSTTIPIGYSEPYELQYRV